MAEVILDEVDWLTCIEQMSCTGMPQAMDVPAIARNIGDRGVTGEKRLDLPFPQATLATNEEC